MIFPDPPCQPELHWNLIPPQSQPLIFAFVCQKVSIFKHDLTTTDRLAKSS